ncbi:MAG: DUF4097 domain-containing protein [Gammaproteobacteria bacterium]
MTNAIRPIGLLIAAFTVLLSTSTTAQDFAWEGSLNSGDVVTIRGVNGKIVAQPAKNDRVTVEATKEARGDDPDSVEIKVIEDSEGVLICAVYPSRKKRKPNRCERGDDYRMNVQNNEVQVDFVVWIPSDINLDAMTVNGAVKVRELEANVDAVTVNGGIDVESAGMVTARTVNGSIDVHMSTSPSEPLEFITVNGGIRFAMPENTNASLDIKTVNGRIESDFPIDIRGRWGPRSAEGEVGDGGAEIKLRTVNGSVRILSD